MLDMGSIGKKCATSVGQVLEYISLLESGDGVALDLETDGVQFPLTRVAGFSIYSECVDHALYIPIGHTKEDGSPSEFNLELLYLGKALQELFSNKQVRVHYGTYDIPLMCLLGFTFEDISDTCVMANMHQCQNLGLKDLVLEFGVVSFRDVISYTGLIAKYLKISEEEVAKIEKEAKKTPEIESELSFCRVNIVEFPEAVEYACNDVIFTQHLYPEILDTLLSSWGDREKLMNALKWQFDTLLILNESTAKGFSIQPDILNKEIASFTKDVGELEVELTGMVKKEFGWV